MNLSIDTSQGCFALRDQLLKDPSSPQNINLACALHKLGKAFNTSAGETSLLCRNDMPLDTRKLLLKRKVDLWTKKLEKFHNDCGAQITYGVTRAEFISFKIQV